MASDNDTSAGQAARGSGGATSDSNERVARPTAEATGGGATLPYDDSPGVSGGVAGGTSGETGSASGTDASADEAAGGMVADERTEPAREDETRDNPRGPGLQPRPDLRGA